MHLVYPVPERKQSFKKHYEGNFMIYINLLLDFTEKKNEFSVEDTNSSWSFVLKILFDHGALFFVFSVKKVASNRIKY